MFQYQSESISNLAKALLAVQSQLEGVPRDSQGYGYKYADLQACYDASRPICVAAGLVINQTGRVENGKNILITNILHVSGEWQRSEVIIEPEDAKDPQSFGSTMTYLRRYYYTAAIGLTQVDDDAATAKKRPQQQQKQSPLKSIEKPPQSAPVKSQVSAAIDKLKSVVAPPSSSNDVPEPDWLREQPPFETGEIIVKQVSQEVRNLRNLAAGAWEFPTGKYVGQKLTNIDAYDLRNYLDYLNKPETKKPAWFKTFEEQYAKFMGL